MASTVNALAPMTPANPSSRPGSKLQDSPFSDYFTDDGRENNGSAFSAPSSETQNLLVRLNKLQSLLMRGEEHEGRSEAETIDIITKNINAIELQLNSVHSQTRMPPELEDSGLFMKEDENDESKDHTPDANQDYSLQFQSFEHAAAAALLSQPITAENRKAEHDFLLLEAQKVLENVTKASEQLRQRCADLKGLNEKHAARMEELEHTKSNLETENEALKTGSEALKTENESLKMDLNFDHTELLFLNLYHKALEVEVEALHNGARRLEAYVPEIKEDIQRVKKARIKQEMRRWDFEWEKVDARMRERRSRYRILSGSAGESGRGEIGLGVDAEAADWQLETVKEHDGRVQRITITRTDSERLRSGTDESVSGGQEPESAQEDHDAEGHSQLPTVTPMEQNPNYTSQSTQTDILSLGPPPSSWLFPEEEEEDGAQHSAPNEDEDCAITTSSEDDNEDDDYSFSSTSADDDGEAGVGEAPTSPLRIAWKDLWEGLSNLAGMGEDRF